MRVAALCDVHGNLPALEAVLAEVEREQPAVVVVGGDLLWGPWPVETLELLRARPGTTLFVRGNTERLVFEEPRALVLDRLSDEQRAFVRSWPLDHTLEIDGLGRVRFVHASPRSDEDYLLPGRETSALTGFADDLLVCGHSHLQFDARIEGVRVVNPGSVGDPTDTPEAAWALLGPDVELRRTAYDVASTAKRIRALGLPQADAHAERLLVPRSWRERVALLVES